jgi:hypothetical protein
MKLNCIELLKRVADGISIRGLRPGEVQAQDRIVQDAFCTASQQLELVHHRPLNITLLNVAVIRG